MAPDDDAPQMSNVERLAAAKYRKSFGDDHTEDGLARAFQSKHGLIARFNHTDGAWYVWDSARWAKEETRLAFNWARELCHELNVKRNPKIAAAATASAVERYAQADRAFAVTSEIFDGDAWILGTPQGVVDLRTGKLRPAIPGDYVTKNTATAPSIDAAPPRWLEFLSEATGEDAGLMGYLQRTAGYALTGDVREHALFFVYGSGGNGKSVFLNTLAGILADYGVIAAADTFTASRGERHPTDMAMLRGARLVVSSETEEGRPWAESRIKSMTGGDMITARFMRRDFFTYRPQFKLIIVGNYRPILRHVDDAMRRRFQIVPFTRRPVVPDRELEHKLRAEWPAILRWAIEGCLEWQKVGLDPPGAVLDATESYFSDQDLMAHWIEEGCRTGVDAVGKQLRTRHADLFHSWTKFAEVNGERSGSAKAFTDALRRRGFDSVRKIGNESVRGFQGIALKNETLGDG